MHRPGRIGRDVFDVDLFVAAKRRAAVFGARLQHDAQLLAPDMGLQSEIDEAGPRDVDLRDQRLGAQRPGDGVGEFARLLTGVLRQHHGGIGRHVAVARIARRLDHDARKICVAGKRCRRRAHAREHGGEKVLGAVHCGCASNGNYQLSQNAGAGAPASRNARGLQANPTLRLRLGVIIRFSLSCAFAKSPAIADLLASPPRHG